jgi:hypothetical protein
LVTNTSKTVILPILETSDDVSRQYPRASRNSQRSGSLPYSGRAVVGPQGFKHVSPEVVPQIRSTEIGRSLESFLGFWQRRDVSPKCGIELDHDIHIAVSTDIGAVSVRAMEIDLEILLSDRGRVTGQGVPNGPVRCLGGLYVTLA